MKKLERVNYELMAVKDLLKSVKTEKRKNALLYRKELLRLEQKKLKLLV